MKNSLNAVFFASAVSAAPAIANDDVLNFADHFTMRMNPQIVSDPKSSKSAYIHVEGEGYSCIWSAFNYESGLVDCQSKSEGKDVTMRIDSSVKAYVGQLLALSWSQYGAEVLEENKALKQKNRMLRQATASCIEVDIF